MDPIPEKPVFSVSKKQTHWFSYKPQVLRTPKPARPETELSDDATLNLAELFSELKVSKKKEEVKEVSEETVRAALELLQEVEEEEKAPSPIKIAV